MTTAADRLLSRLQGVKTAGDHRWSAQCPAHEDRRASLSVRDADGRVLINCFAGCNASDVVGAVGLELRDLFDAPIAHHLQPVRPHADLARVLAAIQRESLVVVIIAEQLARGESLAAENHTRLIRAANTISRAVEASVRAEPPELRRIRRGEVRL